MHPLRLMLAYYECSFFFYSRKIGRSTSPQVDLIIDILYQSSTFVAINEPILIHYFINNNHIKKNILQFCQRLLLEFYSSIGLINACYLSYYHMTYTTLEVPCAPVVYPSLTLSEPWQLLILALQFLLFQCLLSNDLSIIHYVRFQTGIFDLEIYI